jgi:hypothetical protein
MSCVATAGLWMGKGDSDDQVFRFRLALELVPEFLSGRDSTQDKLLY